MQRAQTKQDRATEFSSKRKALNEQFTSWVKAQQTARPDECWADEARQFLEYVGQLKEEFADVLGTPAEPAAKAAEAVTQQARAAPAPAPAPAPAQAASVPASAPSLFSAPPAPAAPFSVPSPFGAPLAGGFSFGAAPTMSFGGGTNPFSALQPAAAAEDAEEDEPERPPSPSVHKSSAEDDGEQVLFEAKSKLFFLGEDKTWSTRGLGNLQLRRPLDASAGASARLILRNDTGKAMLNAKLYSGMKVTVKEGKSLCTTVFNVVAPSAPVGTEGTDKTKTQPAAPADPSSKPVSTMLRFGTNEVASKLKQLIEDCLPK